MGTLKKNEKRDKRAEREIVYFLKKEREAGGNETTPKTLEATGIQPLYANAYLG